MLNGHGTFPPHPMRVACRARFNNSAAATAKASAVSGDSSPNSDADDASQVEALRSAVSVFFNATAAAGTAPAHCFDPS
jgi:hypothetical protein